MYIKTNILCKELLKWELQEILRQIKQQNQHLARDEYDIFVYETYRDYLVEEIRKLAPERVAFRGSDKNLRKE
jgi:methionine synthase I (cobalamin-dependent)